MPTRKLRIVDASGIPRLESRLKIDGHQPSCPIPYATRALVAV